MEPGEAGARAAIADPLAAYHHHGDRLEIEALAGLFTPDGVLDVRGRAPAVGRAAIVAFLGPGQLPTGEPGEAFHVRHHLATVWIERVTPDEARVRAYFSVLTPIGLDHWGRYRDRLVPDGDSGGRVWRFAHRQVAVDGYAPASRFLER